MKYNFRGVSSASPRKCGIAVYNENLIGGTNDFTAEVGSRNIAAIDNEKLIYSRNPLVDIIINQYQRDSWIAGARNIAKRAEERSQGGIIPTIIYVNQEFGLGGKDWESDDNYVAFFEELKNTSAYKKNFLIVMSCLHTLFSNPSQFHKNVTNQIIENSDGTVVMSKLGKIILSNKYSTNLNTNLIRNLDHGSRMYDYSDEDRKELKKSWGEDENTYFVSFPGLISEVKGTFQYGIPGYALAVKKLEELLPNIKTRAIVRGECHPDFVSKKVEFNKFIKRSLNSLNSTGLLLNKRNPFRNKESMEGLGGRSIRNKKHGVYVSYGYLSEKQYSKTFGGSDLMCFPYLNKGQIVSGQLTEAIGHGRDSAASKFWYALETLSDINKAGTLEEILDPHIMPKEGEIIGKNDPDARGLCFDCDRGEETIKQIADCIVDSIVDQDAHQMRADNAHEKGHKMGQKNVSWNTIHFADFIRKRRERRTR